MINWRGVSTVVGGFLIHLTMGTFYTIGNMNPYITSYIRQDVDPSLTYANGIWLSTIFVAGQGCAIGLGGWIQGKIGSGWTCWIGSVVFSLFIAVTFFTIKVSFVAMTLTYSLLPGIGCGIAYSVPMMNSAKWYPKYKGLVIGVTVAGFGLGALVFNQIQTYYLNPDNLLPNDDGYFKEVEVLDKVPGLFLVLSACYIALQTIGSLLIFEADKYLNDELMPVAKATVLDDNPYDLKSPFGVLRHPVFYAMWIMFGLGNVAVNVNNALYKSFGQTFIADDHLLAIVGSLSSIFNCGGRVMWGKVIDKWDSKTTAILMHVALAILFFTFYLTRFMGHVVYSLWVCLIFLALAGQFTLYVGTTARKFGTRYGTGIYWLVFTAGIVSGVAGTPLLQLMLDNFGWFYSYLIVGGLCFVNLMISLFWFG